jgi:signal transduction histidine kinase
MFVRTRIIGLAVWASVLAIGLFGVPLGAAVLQYFVQVAHSDLERTADDIAIRVSPDVSDDEPITHMNRRDSVTFSVYDRDGSWMGGAPPSGPRPQLTSALGGKIDAGTTDDSFVVAVPVRHEDDVIGAVWASTPSIPVYQRVFTAWAAMAGLAAIALAVAWLVGRRQARRLAHPLEDMVVAAQRLGDGDFSVHTRRGGIPEIDSVGMALNATAARLDALVARERAFSADASHQLRTPLAGLRLRLEAALEQPDQDPRPAIAASLADADRLEDTIDELLLLARDNRTTPADPLDLEALLCEMSAEWESRLALQGRRLDLAIHPDVPSARVSTAAVRQVLAVLVDNAMTHGSGTVRVSLREVADAVAIDVADEGPGVLEPASVLFTRRADERTGHGVGLPLARRLVEAEHGRLELAQASPPVFTLLLPAAPAGGLAGDAADTDGQSPQPESVHAGAAVPSAPRESSDEGDAAELFGEVSSKR